MNRALLLLLPLLLAGCSAIQSGNTMDTLVGHSDLTKDILAIYERITWWTLLLFVLVQGMLVYIVIRFRAKGDETAPPEQVHGHTQLEIAWTVLPVLILLHIGIPTIAFIFKYQAPAEAGALTINAVGKQWWFHFEYPEEGFATANELHIPMGRQIDVRLQSDNVIHAFWVPQLAAKRDMVPGRVNRITFKADKAGTYLAQCAEYCGDSHALMRFRVVVETAEEFARWVAAQKAPAETTSEVATAGWDTFQSSGCVACHAIEGTTAQATLGPDLTHVGSRATIGSGIFENNEANLRTWLQDPQAAKPGNKMILPKKLTDEDIATLIPFLQSLK